MVRPQAELWMTFPRLDIICIRQPNAPNNEFIISLSHSYEFLNCKMIWFDPTKNVEVSTKTTHPNAPLLRVENPWAWLPVRGKRGYMCIKVGWFWNQDLGLVGKDGYWCMKNTVLISFPWNIHTFWGFLFFMLPVRLPNLAPLSHSLPYRCCTTPTILLIECFMHT